MREKPTESGFHKCQRISKRKWFVTFNKYSIIAFVLWVEDSAVKKVRKVHDLGGENRYLISYY